MLGRLVNPIAALAAEIAVIDSDLGDELRRTTRRVVALVRLLEPVLRHFAQLELRLERTIAQVEEATGQEVSDDLRNRLAGQLGILVSALRWNASTERILMYPPRPVRTTCQPECPDRAPEPSIRRG
jgi:hypothetical protein